MIKQKEDTVMTVRTLNEVGPAPLPSDNNHKTDEVRVSAMLSPMPYIMTAIGSVTPNDKMSRYLKIYIGFILESVTLQAIMAIVNTYSDATTADRFENTIQNFFNLLITITSLCSLHLMQNTEHTVMEVLQEHCYLISSNESTKKLIMKLSKVLSLLGCIHSLVLLLSEGYGLYVTPLNEISQKLPFGLRNLGGKYPEAAFLVVCFQRFIYAMFVQSPLTHHMSFFALVCFYFSRIYEAFSRNLKEKLADTKPNDLTGVRGICTLYFQLCHSVKTVNSIFSNIVIFWCTYAFLNSCWLIRKILDTKEAYESWFLVDLPIGVVAFAAYVSMYVNADSLIKHAGSSSLAITMYLSENGDIRQEVYNLFKMLIDKMVFNPPCVMVWNCFKMDKFSVFVSVATLFVYTIVLIEVL